MVYKEVYEKNKMRYLDVFLFWFLVNVPIYFVGVGLKANISYLTLYFLAGVFLISLFALAEFIGDVREIFEDLEYERRG